MKALKTNITLAELNLSINKIKDDGVIVLATLLKTNTILKKLDLTNNYGIRAEYSIIREILKRRKIKIPVAKWL